MRQYHLIFLPEADNKAFPDEASSTVASKTLIHQVLYQFSQEVNMGILSRNSQKGINFFSCYYITLFLAEPNLWPHMVILKFLCKRNFCLEIYQYKDVFEAHTE